MARCGGESRPRASTRCADPRNGLEALVDRIRIEPERGRDGAGGKLAAGGASRLEDPLILVGQALDLPLDQMPQALRKDIAERLHWLPQSPGSLLLREDPLRHELIEQRGEKERISVGDLEGRCPEGGWELVGGDGWELVGGETKREIPLHVRLGERPESELARMTARQQTSPGRSERMPADDDVGRPVGAEEEEARWLFAHRERRKQVDRRRVAPLEIVEPENQRTLRGERLHGIAHLAQHPLAIRAGDASEKPLVLHLREERRHLGEPGRRVPTEDVENPIPAGTAAHRRQRLQDRQVGLSGSVLLDALPAGDAKLVAGGGGGEEVAGQRRLADSRLSGEEQDLPRPRTAASSHAPSRSSSVCRPTKVEPPWPFAHDEAKAVVDAASIGATNR